MFEVFTTRFNTRCQMVTLGEMDSFITRYSALIAAATYQI